MVREQCYDIFYCVRYLSMRSWFWRIFISFWIAVAVIAASTFGLGRWMIEDRFIVSLYPYLSEYAPGWTRLYEEQGIDAAQQYARKMAQEHRIYATVLSSDGDVLSAVMHQNHMPPMQGRGMGMGMRRGERLGMRQANYGNVDVRRATYEYTSAGGEQYLFRFMLPADGFRAWQSRTVLIPLTLLFTVLALSLVSWLLSRSITKPISRLRTAVKDLEETSFQSGQIAYLGERCDEIGMLARDFQRMGERLQTQLTTQRRLLRDVSHELRSPLARLRIALGLAEKQSGHETIAPQTWGQLQRECDRLDQLIGEILALARFDSSEEMPETIHLNALLQDIIDEHRNLRIQFEASEDIDIEGWPHWLDKTFSNLLRNAERFNPPDRPVDISLWREQQTARIRFRDHGSGCPPEVLKKLGEPFFRAPGQTTHGYGLGLAIARRAIERHGGAIRFNNAAPHGFVVDIELPLNHKS